MKTPVLLTVAVFLGTTPVLRAQAPSPADMDFFEKQVRPLLVKHCWGATATAKPRAG